MEDDSRKLSRNESGFYVVIGMAVVYMLLPGPLLYITIATGLENIDLVETAIEWILYPHFFAARHIDAYMDYLGWWIKSAASGGYPVP